MIKILSVLLFFFILILVFIPTGIQAQEGLVVCDGIDTECSIPLFVQEVQKFINFVLLVLAAPLAAVIFGYAGILQLTARGNQGQLDKAKTAFKSAGIGLIIIAGAWLVVYTVVETLIDPNFNIPEEVELQP